MIATEDDIELELLAAIAHAGLLVPRNATPRQRRVIELERREFEREWRKRRDVERERW